MLEWRCFGWLYVRKRITEDHESSDHETELVKSIREKNELDLVGYYNSESEIYLFRMPRYLRWLTWLEDTKESRNYTQGQYWVGGRHSKGCGKEWWVCSLLWVRQSALEIRPQKGTSRGRQILGSFRKNKHLTEFPCGAWAPSLPSAWFRGWTSDRTMHEKRQTTFTRDVYA